MIQIWLPHWKEKDLSENFFGLKMDTTGTIWNAIEEQSQSRKEYGIETTVYSYVQYIATLPSLSYLSDFSEVRNQLTILAVIILVVLLMGITFAKL